LTSKSNITDDEKGAEPLSTPYLSALLLMVTGFPAPDDTVEASKSSEYGLAKPILKSDRVDEFNGLWDGQLARLAVI
jgi:hypothetical protein